MKNIPELSIEIQWLTVFGGQDIFGPGGLGVDNSLDLVTHHIDANILSFILHADKKVE